MTHAQHMAAITARLEAATPGPWGIFSNEQRRDMETLEANASLIKHAPTDLAYLKARVETLEDLVLKYRDCHHEVADGGDDQCPCLLCDEAKTVIEGETP